MEFVVVLSKDEGLAVPCRSVCDVPIRDELFATTREIVLSGQPETHILQSPHGSTPSRYPTMQATRRILTLAVGFSTIASTLAAQGISIGLRGSGTFPTGSFSETTTQATANTAPGPDLLVSRPIR